VNWKSNIVYASHIDIQLKKAHNLSLFFRMREISKNWVRIGMKEKLNIRYGLNKDTRLQRKGEVSITKETDDCELCGNGRE
jgi:hypothetical protein